MTNRMIAPPVYPVQQIFYPKAQKHLLKNGLPLYIIDAGSQDVIKLEFIFEAGGWQQDERFIAGFCNQMLQEGSANYTSAQIAETFDFYGAYLQLGADQNYSTISIISLNKHFPNIIKVTEDLIKRSVFPQHELDVLTEKQKQRFKLENEKVKTLCQKKFTTALFGNGHPYSMDTCFEDFDIITRDKLVTFYHKHYHSGNCKILLSGKITSEIVEVLELSFGETDWAGTSITEKNYTAICSDDKTHWVEKENALQSAIRVGRYWVDKSHQDQHALSVLVTILGGYFGSRLMTNIREEKGYTYGIGAYVVNLKNAAYLMISTEVGNEYVEPTLKEINLELKRLQDEIIPHEELESVKSYLLGEFLRDFDGMFALLSSFKNINDFGLDYSFYDQYLKVINTISPETLQLLARKYLSPDEMVTVVVGAPQITK